ncbi:uncharacterized protein [Dysidea avara]|uniref:uncharacterized protein n=1 Tax=Dysidea avara TaxID=196820 RepID=UPI00331E5399
MRILKVFMTSQIILLVALCIYFYPYHNHPIYSLSTEQTVFLHDTNINRQSNQDLTIPVQPDNPVEFEYPEDVNSVDPDYPVERVNTVYPINPAEPVNLVEDVNTADLVDHVEDINPVNSDDKDDIIKREKDANVSATEETFNDDLKQEELDALLLEESNSPQLHNDHNLSRGYILPFTIFEEQTNGAKNLWQLQILANKLGMKIVEPFIVDSLYFMDRLAPNFNRSLRFGDYFDKDLWNEMVIKRGGNPLVEWEEFLSYAPHEVILLYFRRVKGSEALIIDEHTELCGQQYKPEDMKWLQVNFKIIKRLCYRFPISKKHFLTIPEFISRIFNDINPNEVTLIIRSWLGVRPSRIDLRPISPFLSAFDPNLLLPPSKRIMKAFQAYKSQNIGNKKYVGILFRTHHVLYYNKYAGNFTGMSQVLLQCSRQLKEELDTVRDNYEIFMACDLGSFGSKKHSTYRVGRLLPLRDQIYLDVFNGSVTVEGRDEKLKQAAGGVTDRGFIAELERVIATYADCIILLGAGSGFVSAAAMSYVSLHPGEKCIVPICFTKVFDSHTRQVLSRHHLLT